MRALERFLSVGILSTALSAALLLPAGAASAASAAPPVDVAAIVDAGDGRLSFLRGRVASARQGQALLRRWRGSSRVVASAPVQPVRSLAVDPMLGEQWALRAVTPGASTSAGPAGSQVIAVLDTGVDASHPDLAGVVLPGRDLVAPGVGTSDPSGHGTHIAGIVAAVRDNGVGVAGLAQGAHILPIRVLDANGWGTDVTVAEGIVWAVDHGATVVNLSLAGSSPSALLDTAIAYALRKNVVVVAGSGNSGEHGDPVQYPAATPGVIAVGAVNRDSVRPAWSSSGAHLAIVAPGASILSTLPGGRYGNWSGTSMAAPFVSAAAAVLRQADPRLTPSQVRERLMASARDLGVNGFDSAYGAGLLDVAAARARVVPVKAAAPAPALASAAPKAQLTTPVTTMRTSRSAAVVAPRRPVTLSARVLADGKVTPRAAVTLERRVGHGRWIPIRRGTTSGVGLVSFTIAPDVTGTHRFVSSSVASAELPVTVRKR